jgi:transcription initiation factor TFIIE subunit alpha
MLRNETKKLIKKLERRLEFENNEFYVCTAEPPHRILFDYAVDANFTCPIDGMPMEYDDNSKEKVALQHRIEKLKQTVKL